MMKLSIIIPVYNVEQYLRKCMESLIHQDFTGYEVILVDDGSTDKSGKICDELCETISDERLAIRVIHQKNGGLSAARNSGIEVAQGEYVMFVDSDDYIEPNVLGGLIEQMERDKLDVLKFDYRNVRIVKSNEVRGKNEYEVFQPYKQPHKVDKRDDVVDGMTYLNERMGYECYAVMYIIRRELVPMFTPGIHFEDVDWLPRMLLNAKKVGSTGKVVYNYFWREGSITLTRGNKEKIRKNLDDRMEIIEKYCELQKQHPACVWLRNMQSSMVAGVLTTVAREFYQERDVYIKRLRECNVFPLAIADHGKTHARRARTLNLLGPYIFCLLMHLR